MMEKNKDILCCIFNHNNAEGAFRWLHLMENSFDTLVLDSGSNERHSEFITLPNIYYGGLMKLSSDRCIQGGYKWLIIITSDVQINDENGAKLIDRINQISKQSDVGLYTPSIDLTSADTYRTFNNGTSNLYEIRGVNGFFTLIKNDIIKDSRQMIECLTIGWGDDVVFNKVCLDKNLKTILDCGVIIHHPKGTGYNIETASKELSILMDNYDLKSFRAWSKINIKNKIYNMNDGK